jgi:hypothetical protein
VGDLVGSFKPLPTRSLISLKKSYKNGGGRGIRTLGPSSEGVGLSRRRGKCRRGRMGQSRKAQSLLRGTNGSSPSSSGGESHKLDHRDPASGAMRGEIFRLGLSARIPSAGRITPAQSTVPTLQGFLGHCPPSTKSSVPLTKLLSSEARKTTAFATSSGAQMTRAQNEAVQVGTTRCEFSARLFFRSPCSCGQVSRRRRNAEA